VPGKAADLLDDGLGFGDGAVGVEHDVAELAGRLVVLKRRY